MASILGREITGAQLFWERTLAIPSFPEFRQRVTGQVVQKVGRRGKFLLLSLANDTILFHLRMSGDLLVEPGSAPLNPHVRLFLDLSGNLRLAFNDARKFGRVWLLNEPEDVLAALGPEPFDPGFTPEELHRRLVTRRRQLKPLLLDQTFIAGLGNIYADEALYLAKLHPNTLSHTLSIEQTTRLWSSIRQVLSEGIQRQGATIDWVYRGGDFQNYFRVYQRTGEPCLECQTSIVRIVIGQRSTHFCPFCQPQPE